MAGDTHGAETQEEPKAQEDLGRQQAAQGQPQVSGNNWEKAVAERDEKIAALEAQVAEAAKNAKTAEKLRCEIAELKAQGESVCAMAHTDSYVLSAVMCRDRRRRCTWRGPRHITRRPSERVQEVQDALRRLVTRVSGIAPFDSDLLEGLLLCLHVRHHVLVRGVDVLVAEPDGNGGDIDPGI